MQELTRNLIERHAALLLTLAVASLLAFGALLHRCFRWHGASALLPAENPKPDIPFVDLIFVSALLYAVAKLMGGLWVSWFAILTVAFIWFARQIPWGHALGLGFLPWNRVLLGSVWIGLAAYLPLQVMAACSEEFFFRMGWPKVPQAAVEMFLQAEDPWSIAQLVFLAVVLAPVSEEMLFRGFLQPVLKNVAPRSVAVAVSATVFAALHGHVQTMIPLLFLGFLLGLVYESKRSLLLCMGIHACFNLITTSLLLLAKFGTE